MKNKKLGIFGLLLLMLIPMQAMATELPAMIVAYKEVVSGIITQVIVGLVILIMFVYSAWEAYQNANARPFKWALFAAIVMGSAVFFGPSILDYASTNFSSFTGAASGTSSF